MLDCGAAREFGEEVAPDSEDEMSRVMKQVDVVKGLFRSRTSGRVRADEVELNKKMDIDVIPADESSAGETRPSQELWHELDLVQPTYVGPHEPEASSEATALNFVENFLLLSNIDLSPETHLAKMIKEKSPAFPSVKGIIDVAKRISSSSSIQGAEIFEWVDTPYTKETSVICASSCRTYSEKHRDDTMKSQNNKGGGASAYQCSENAEFVNIKNKNVASVPYHLESDTHGLKVQGETVNHGHLMDIDQPLNGETSEHMLSSAFLGGERAEAFDIGLCTQMAAEAMEALSHAASSSSPLLYQDPQSTYNTSPEDERDRIASLNMSPHIVCSCSKRQLHTRSLGTSASTPECPKRQKPETTLETRKKMKTESSPIKKSAKGENLSGFKRISGSSIVSKRRRRDVGDMKLDVLKDVDGHVGLTSTRNKVSSRKRQSSDNSVGLNSLSPLPWQFKLGARTNMRKNSGGIAGDLEEICLLRSKIVKFTANLDRFEDNHRVKQRGLFPYASEIAKNRGINNQEKTGVMIDLLGLLSRAGTWKHPRGKRTNRNTQIIQNNDVDLNTTITGKRDRNISRKFTSNDLCTKLHQFGWNNGPLPSENKIGVGSLMHKRSSKPVMLKELIGLGITDSLPDLMWKDLRKRRHMAFVRVLFSLHLDHDRVMQQNKVLKRLGISTASSSEDATHFIADRFFRTRHMLEAIALGKPVVTHLWLESCGQAGCLIDERNFILRDGKKEKELGFNMAASLANARQNPILKGKKVLITRSVKPSKEMLISLIEAVHGQAKQRNQIPTTEDGIIPDEVLIISCEEDQAVCAPLLRKGGKVYSSELILSGVVTQRLEYDRYELFKSNVETDRSSTKLIKTRRL